MGDYVAFATAENTTTPELSSGFNGFPSRFITDITGVEGYYPANVDLAKLVKWYWRVRKWTVTTDLEIRAGTGAGEVNLSFASGDNNCEMQFASRENHLCYPGCYATGTVFPTGSSLGTGGGSVSLFAAPNTPSIYESIGLLYPYISVGFTAAIEETFPPDRIFIDVSSISQPAPDAHVTGTIDGVSIPLDLTVGLGSVGTYSYTFTNFTMVPLEYWPYADEQGNPVYDTSTGDPL